MRNNLLVLPALLFLASCAPHTINTNAIELGTMPQTGKILDESPADKSEGNIKVKEQITNEKKVSVKAEQIKAWNISGALAAKGNGKSVTASFNWRQVGAANYRINLFGPLGSGSVVIDRHAGMTTYRDGPKKDIDPNAERLFKRQTGVDLPVDRLYFWVRGLAAPGAIQGAKRDSQGSLQSFQQGGYHVTCLNYMESHGLRLPGKVQIQGPNVVVKVVIKGWRV